MSKIKPLKPSLKEKKRYVVFEIDCKSTLAINMVNKAIQTKYQELFGLFGAAEAGILPLENKYNPKTKTGILRINHKCVDNLRTTFTFITNINKKPVGLRTVGVSGILKKALTYGG